MNWTKVKLFLIYLLCPLVMMNIANKEKLHGIAFVESTVLITSVQVIRNLVVAADHFQGISIFKFKAEMIVPIISYIIKDPITLRVSNFIERAS